MALDSTAQPVSRTQAAGIGVAGFYSAAVAYVVLLIAAHTLSSADNAVFLTFWALLFGGFGVVTGVNAESARAAFDGDVINPRTVPSTRSGPGGSPTHARIVPVAVGFGGALFAVVALTSPLWGPLTMGRWWPLVLVVAVAGTFYAGHLSLSGVLTGLHRWSAVAGLTAAESTVRLVGVSVVALVWGTLPALAVASALSALTWSMILVAPSGRALLRRRADGSARRLVTNFVGTCSASASSAAVTVGYPVLIALTASRTEFLASAGLLLAITLTRAPMMVPLTAFQGVALTYFLSHRRRGPAAVLPVIAVLAAVTVVAVVAAYFAGPWLFTLLLGGRYAISGLVLAGLTAAAGLLAIETITGMCCLALGRRGGYVTGWLVSTVVAVVLLLVPGELTSRVVSSLVLGTTAGVVVHLGALGVGDRVSRVDGPNAEPPTSTP